MLAMDIFVHHVLMLTLKDLSANKILNRFIAHIDISKRVPVK